jgi:hypothetical protein
VKLAWLFALVLVAGAGTVRHADAQAPPPLVAILEPGPKATPSGGVQHFTEALADLGWVDGRTRRACRGMASRIARHAVATQAC